MSGFQPQSIAVTVNGEAMQQLGEIGRLAPDALDALEPEAL